jgi:CRISPR system Cascade subunit CasC
MTTFLQLHLLTAYPPANLNRDDNGQPKTAVFGGAQRLRISSQSLKRAWRTSDIFASRLAGHIGARTQRIGKEVFEYVCAKGCDEKKATKIARDIADLFGKTKDEGDDNPLFIEQLAFIAPEERAKAFALADRMLAGETSDLKPADVLVKADGAADIAMFGRMLADDPGFNREAAVQVAHAISTHRVVLEDDYYTAVDDLKTAANSEDAGTSFIGVQEFAAGVFYLYICVDLDLLVRNLGGDAEVARAAVGALIEAAAQVAPRGKQNSFASRAQASFVLAEAGSDQPRTLAAAFLKPVKAEDEDQAVLSAQRLCGFRKKLADAYGDAGTETRTMDATGEKTVGTLAEIVAFAQGKVLGAVS